MNELSPFPDNGMPVDEALRPKVQASRGRPVLALFVLALLAGTLGYGFWQHYSLHAEVIATADQRRDFVPSVRTAAIRASKVRRSVSPCWAVVHPC